VVQEKENWGRTWVLEVKDLQAIEWRTTLVPKENAVSMAADAPSAFSRRWAWISEDIGRRSGRPDGSAWEAIRGMGALKPINQYDD
jgi:hypothetical protein